MTRKHRFRTAFCNSSAVVSGHNNLLSVTNDVIHAIGTNAIHHTTSKTLTPWIFSLFNLRSQTLADGNKVNFAGFGTFEPRYRKARKGRNPKTGEEIDIAASVGAGFSAAKALKEKLNDK